MEWSIWGRHWDNFKGTVQPPRKCLLFLANTFSKMSHFCLAKLPYIIEMKGVSQKVWHKYCYTYNMKYMLYFIFTGGGRYDLTFKDWILQLLSHFNIYVKNSIFYSFFKKLVWQPLVTIHLYCIKNILPHITFCIFQIKIMQFWNDRWGTFCLVLRRNDQR